MLEPPHRGRVYRGTRRIRLADADASGRLRLDAAARYMQDVAADDVDDAGIADADHVWIVRRSQLEVREPFQQDRVAELATWSGGLGARWAARRTRISGDRGGRIEAETVWVYLDAATMRLARLPDSFGRVYGEAAPDASVTGRLGLRREPPAEARSRGWPLRATDIDILGHVNNAVHWEAVEEELAERGYRPVRRARLEYRASIDLRDPVTLRTLDTEGGFCVWFVAAGNVAAVAEVGFGPARA